MVSSVIVPEAGVVRYCAYAVTYDVFVGSDGRCCCTDEGEYVSRFNWCRSCVVIGVVDT